MFGHETFPAVLRDAHQVKQSSCGFHIVSFRYCNWRPVIIEVWLYLCLPVIQVIQPPANMKAAQTSCNLCMIKMDNLLQL